MSAASSRARRLWPVSESASHARGTAGALRLFLGGQSPPRPSRGRGRGETRFPHTPAPGKVLPGRAAPPPGGGLGKPGFPRPLREGQALPRAGVWGNRVSPHPCSRKGSSWEGCAPTGWGCGETRFPHALAPGKVLPGRAAPSHRVGVWGNRVSPYSCVRARPSRGRGCGETGFPHTPLRELIFTLVSGFAATDI